VAGPLRAANLSPRRGSVGAFIEHLLATRTASTRYNGCRQLFNWLVEDGEIPDSSMARMRSPKLHGCSRGRHADAVDRLAARLA